MRALVVVLLLCRAAHAELPTIESEHPPALRVTSGSWSTRFERVALAIHAAPEPSWLTIAVTGRDRPFVLSIDVPDGTRVIGLAVANGQAAAWGRPLPVDRARDRFRTTNGSALVEWTSKSADEEHLTVRLDQASTIEIALELPPLARLEVAASAGAVSVEVGGEKRFAGKGGQRAVVELDDLAGHVGDATVPVVDEHVAIVAAESAPTEFFGPPSFGPRVMRDLDKAMIRRRMTAHRAQLRRCYMAVAQWNPTLSHGDVVMTFMIGESGDVEWARPTETDLPASVTDCLAAEVTSWEFPATDGRVLVNYPLRFELLE